ncbi:hypothetical protein [Georgenia sp. SYP-B2076]|uniref:hypothetical protein n=1 Tax=Georgenia sp. SYP-B2076 TaxID=2495881 RepID=UPI000F8DDC6B|nr:hypothetical protein [Georgenia sp. SYP-B2076]
MRLRVKNVLPEAPEGFAWSLRRRGDAVELRLRTRGLRREVMAAWSTENFSSLAPNPADALVEVATQMAGNVDAEYYAVA